jgi:hypothetical protein
MNERNSLILHYLRVDHIGHAQRALNSLIREKLFQTDEII